jgi:hypothetical protein
LPAPGSCVNSAERQLGTLPRQLGLDYDMHLRFELQPNGSQQGVCSTGHDQCFGAIRPIDPDLIDVLQQIDLDRILVLAQTVPRRVVGFQA